MPDTQSTGTDNMAAAAQAPMTDIYSQLPLANSQIRLLQISNDRGDISCRLEVFSVDQAPSFLALSYEWASAEDPALLLINQKQCKIRANLYDFIRRTTVDEDFALKWWWIDAVCINQDDLQERGHQVKMMAQIYSQASSVIAWLGLARDYCQIAIHKMRTCRTNSTSPWSRHECRAIVDLCQRPYWTRLWVLQELTLSRHTVFIIGNIKIEGFVLIDFAEALLSENLAAFALCGDLLDLVIGSPAMFMLGESRKSIHSISLCKRVIASRHLQCSSKHDKIFAVLSISNPATTRLSPDYKVTMEAILYTVLCDDLASANYTLADSEDIYVMVASLYKVTGVIPLGLKCMKRTRVSTEYDVQGLGWRTFGEEQAHMVCDSNISEGRRLLGLLPRPEATAALTPPWLATHSSTSVRYSEVCELTGVIALNLKGTNCTCNSTECAAKCRKWSMEEQAPIVRTPSFLERRRSLLPHPKATAALRSPRPANHSSTSARYSDVYELTGVVPLGFEGTKCIRISTECAAKYREWRTFMEKQVRIVRNSTLLDCRRLLLPHLKATAALRPPLPATPTWASARYPEYIWFSLGGKVQIESSPGPQAQYFADQMCSFAVVGRGLASTKLSRPIWASNVSDATMESRDDW